MVLQIAIQCSALHTSVKGPKLFWDPDSKHYSTERAFRLFHPFTNSNFHLHDTDCLAHTDLTAAETKTIVSGLVVHHLAHQANKSEVFPSRSSLRIVTG